VLFFFICYAPYKERRWRAVETPAGRSQRAGVT
jgi:hypothetical protein